MAITLRDSGNNTAYTANTTIEVTGLSVTSGDIIVVLLGVHQSGATAASNSVSDSITTSYTIKSEEQEDANHAPIRIAWGIAGSTDTVTVTGTYDATECRKSIAVYVFNPNGATITEDFYPTSVGGYVSADTQITIGNENVESSDAVAIFGSSRGGLGAVTWNSPLIDGVAVDGSQTPDGMLMTYTIFSATDTGVAAAVTPDVGAQFQMVFLGLQGAAGGGANPKGPFGLPLHGPFGGPIS